MESVFQPPQLVSPFTKLQLFISCSNLKDVDILGSSDPFVIIYMKEGEVWNQIGKTEMIKDNLNPLFQTSFFINYFFEKHQYLKFEVLDGDNMSGKSKIIGSTQTTVGTIVGSPGSSLTTNVMNKNKISGQITLKFESVQESDIQIVMKLGGRNLTSTKSCFICSNNNIILEIYRQSSDNKSLWLKVHESEPIADNTNPMYPPLSITGQKLCNSNKNLPIQFRFYNVVNIQRTLIGQCNTTLAQIMDKRIIDLQNNQMPAGNLIIDSIDTVEKPIFIDYLKGGMQINVSVAIDYTASNGQINEPSSLHFLGP